MDDDGWSLLQIADFEHACEAESVFLDLHTCDDDEVAYLAPEVLEGGSATKVSKTTAQFACPRLDLCHLHRLTPQLIFS